MTTSRSLRPIRGCALTEPQNLTPEQRLQELGQAALGVPAPLGGLHELTAEGGDVQVISSGWRLAWREFASNKLAVFALVLLIAIVLFCYLGPLFYHSDQTQANPLQYTLPPGPGHPLGTDENGLGERGLGWGWNVIGVGFRIFCSRGRRGGQQRPDVPV